MEDTPEIPGNTIRRDYSFAVVPEWLIEAKVSDRAVRLFALLDRLADNGTKESWYSRKSLAERLGCSVDTLDRATRELVKVGAATVEKRHRADGSQTSNVITLTVTPAATVRPPRRTDAAPRSENQRSERTTSTDPAADAFSAFWKEYPRKEQKADALKAFTEALGGSVEASEIIAGAKGYAEELARLGTERRFTKLPAGWLREGRWAMFAPAAVPERFAKSGWRLADNGDLISADGSAVMTCDPGGGWTDALGVRYGRDGRERR